MAQFDGKVVWITGGGSGIGKALALEFASRGARVAVSGRRAAKLKTVMEQIEVSGGKGLALVCDVTDDTAVRASVARVVETWGRLDVVVANAGFGVSGLVEKLTADDWRRQMEVNVVGAASTVFHSLPELRKTGGRLALVASVASFAAMPTMGAYAASKAAVRVMGLTLSQELFGSGVSCTTIHPGFVASEIAQVDNRGRHDASRKDPRPANLMWPADKAARVMVRAIQRRKREFVFTAHGRLGAFVGQHMPGFVHFVMTRMGLGKKAQKSAKNPTLS